VKKSTEAKLIAWCKEKWDQNLHVTRCAIFRAATTMNRTFLGGGGGHWLSRPVGSSKKVVLFWVQQEAQIILSQDIVNW